jgi:hypothetical protein
MSSEVWLKTDVVNILHGVAYAHADLASFVYGSDTDQPQLDSYSRGFQAALAALALSFGVLPAEFSPLDAWPTVGPQPRARLITRQLR